MPLVMAAEPPHPRIAGRRIRVGLYDPRSDRVVVKLILPAGSDITLGGGEDATLRVPAWDEAPIRLLASGHQLHMEPGMRVHMCHDDGEARVQVDFDGLEQRGLCTPLTITVSKVNVTLPSGRVVYLKYLTESEPDWPREGKWSD